MLPPHSDYIFRGIKDSIIYYIITIIVSAVTSLFFYFFLKRNTKKEDNNNYLILVFWGGLLVGWLNMIIYCLSILVFAILGYLGLLMTKKIKYGTSTDMTPYIILAIIFTLVIGNKISVLIGFY
jgi:uncharacterized membrane protein